MECPGCLKEFTDPRLLPCKHTYCLSCLQMLNKTKGRIQCQVCKALHKIPEKGAQGFPRSREKREKIFVLTEMSRSGHYERLRMPYDLREADVPRDSDGRMDEATIMEKRDAIANKYFSKGGCHSCKRDRATSVTCTFCHIPNYCSKKCARNDWESTHMLDCHDFHTLTVALFDVHTRDHITPKYKAKLALLSSYYDPHCCSNCEKSSAECSPGEKLRLCCGCAVARYCSARCQAEDWGRRHGEDCREIRRARSVLHDDASPDLPPEDWFPIYKLGVRLDKNISDQPRRTKTRKPRSFHKHVRMMKRKCYVPKPDMFQ